MRYGVFSEFRDYPTDTRNHNDSFDLWKIRSSDYPADTRKSSGHNDFRQIPFLANRRGAVRACLRQKRGMETAGRRGDARNATILTSDGRILAVPGRLSQNVWWCGKLLTKS